jgi:hypothetical protein
MTVYEYAMLRVARELMTDDEVASAAKLAEDGDKSDLTAAGTLWCMAEAIVTDPKRRGVIPPLRCPLPRQSSGQRAKRSHVCRFSGVEA